MADPAQLNVGVLISGSGSNLQALIDRMEDGSVPARIALVISNQPNAFGLERARRAGIPACVIHHRDFADRESFEQAMIIALEEAGVELVCLAGFMRVLTPCFIRAFHGRLLNIHPALLPAFPGLHVQQRAIEAGVRFSGATVHFVTEEVDAGPIVAQAVVPILENDTSETLAARILKQEHRIYPLAVALYAQKRLRIEGQRVRILNPTENPAACLIAPNPPAA
ncbi:MAG: phosphoribosylglycinamide formyltransferase [Magnetococcales bacterium]|nr:phosphoribosylglycinamide formyltransferase [Magnetococcales bacterium]NGZ05584.1 phosphoribosylglycinamide formyltransferase [Magnetococcales bacterium]